MGSCLSQEPEVDFDGPVDFNHFHILRAIGKGAFGKVCIVKKKDTKQMYAMKYMNKIQIIRKHAVENVFREIKILCSLEHPFLVNLWFTFQDREDMFLVMDLMLGGDISYHLEKHGKFSVPRVRLYMAEVALALDYLKSKSIVHRDIKPANMLLDSQGHVHVTDFNVASIVRPNIHITSTTGTKPYMAPEVVQAPSTGYLYAVDWWSLGVSAYEMLRGHRPFAIDKGMSSSALYHMLMHTRPSASANWDTQTCDVLKMLLHPDSSKRLQTVDSLRSHPFFQELSWTEVEEKTIVPPFIPPQNRINCDPTHELEEMIVEPNPLHKKRHRLSKRSVRTEEEAIEIELNKIENQFQDYNRERDKNSGPEELDRKVAEADSEAQSDSTSKVTASPDKVVGSPDKLTGTPDKVLDGNADASKKEGTGTETVPMISVDQGEVHRKEAKDAVQDSKDAKNGTSTTSLSSNVSPPTTQQPATGENLNAEAAMAPADSAVEASTRDSAPEQEMSPATPPLMGRGESITADTAPLMGNGSPMEHGAILTVQDLDD